MNIHMEKPLVSKSSVPEKVSHGGAETRRCEPHWRLSPIPLCIVCIFVANLSYLRPSASSAVYFSYHLVPFVSVFLWLISFRHLGVLGGLFFLFFTVFYGMLVISFKMRIAPFWA